MIELTQDLVKELFDYRDGKLYWKEARANNSVKAGELAGTITENGYLKIGINGIQYYAHRLIYIFHNAFCPPYLDHIDGDKLNNSISNIREATQQQNRMNRKKDKHVNGKPTSSKYKGVSWHKQTKKWIVYIQINGEREYLGIFTSEIEAALTYNRAAIKYFGNYAYLNIISQPYPLNTMPSNRCRADQGD